jgi:predicted metalloprotease with PDZ domain
VQARTVRLSGEDMPHSLYMAGKIRCHVRELKGRQVGFAIAGSGWGFTDERFVDLAMSIVRAEREFFEDHSDEWFLVSIVPTATMPPGSLSLGGTGLTNCFARFVNDGLTLEPGSREDRALKHLLAHEYFHTWNGRKIKRTSPPSGPTEELVYWFSEGFTDFYARRLLLRAGLWDAKTATEDLNSSVSTYWFSPVKGEPNTRIREDFWNSREVRELPYRRGDLLALAIDEKIRQVSGGKKSLDDLMRELFKRAREKDERITTENLIATIESFTDTAFAAEVAACVEKGGEVPLPKTVTEPALKLTMAEQRGEDLGFDFEASRAAKKVTGLREGSAAWQAGLREGQVLKGWSIERSRGDGPPKAKVEVEVDGERKAIEYTPVGEAVEVPRYEAVGA